MREYPLHHIHHADSNVRRPHLRAIANRGAKLSVIQKAFLVVIMIHFANSF